MYGAFTRPGTASTLCGRIFRAFAYLLVRKVNPYLGGRKKMKSFKSHKSVCIAGLLFASLGTAHACEIWRDEVWKIWRGNCNLTIDPKAPQIKQPFIDGTRSPIRFRWPDLTIDKFKFNLIGNSLEVYADVTNIGDQASIATNIGLTVTTFDPRNPVPQATSSLPVVPVPPIPASATRRIYVGTVFVDYSAHDVDVATSGMVDQVTAAQPVRGTVVEADETNNSLIHMCRVFGPTPDATLRACN
jgi:hypothetical protein